MVLEDLAILTAILGCLVIIYYKWWYGFWKKRNVVHIPPTIPFGNASNPVKPSEPLHVRIQNLYNLAKAKKEIHAGFYFLANPIYVPVDPDLLRHVFSVDFNHFMDRGTYVNEMDDPLSANLFGIKGGKWKHLRTKLTPTFTSGKMKNMFFIILGSANNMINHLNEDILPKTETVNVKETMGCFTTDVIGSAAFGLECNCFKDKNSAFRFYGQKVFKPSASDQFKVVVGFTMPNLARKLKFPLFNKGVTNFFTDLIRRTVEYRKKNNVVRKDFLQLLIDLTNNEEDPLTFNELAAQCFVFFLAGFETSSTNMTFALYEMALNPKVQERAREEVLKVLKKHGGEWTYEAIMDMKYLQQVVDETLRKYPALPTMNRRITKSYKVPGTNLVLNEGMDVFIPTYAIHHDPEYYPNPEVFDPERFTEENKQARKHYTYIPFGEGPRNCIGLRFGLLQSKIGLALLLKNYNITLNPLTKVPLVLDPMTFVISAKDDILLNMKRNNV